MGTALTRIGIDARMYGLEHAGIGRYVMNLVDRLIEKNLSIRWVIFCHPTYAAHFSQQPNVEVVTTTIRHYSLAEQTVWVKMLTDAKLDLLHVPHFNVPLLYHRPFVVTIHDILWHHVQGGKVTTLPPWLYYLKYVGYRQVVNHAIRQAATIFTPSKFVKEDLIKEFTGLNPATVKVTYEGVTVPKTRSLEPKTEPPYILYVGSAYPHKNIPMIFKALEHLPEMRLKLVGSRSVFLDQLKRELHQSRVYDRVEFMGRLTDNDLFSHYRRATCLVHPSLSEGFGLTGLEAMAAGCPVVAAKSSCLPEIYGDAAMYFDPHNDAELAKQVQNLQNEHLRADYIAKGLNRVKRYSWDSMVNETLTGYMKALA